jgi:chitin disaccharide deacetylase
MKKLIINADDYGLSPLFNKGILELAEKKIITSISVMIKRKYIKKSDLQNLEGFSIGLHLELDENSTKAEIERQVEKFAIKLGKLPSHLDGHQHKHLTPNNLPKVISVAKKYYLPIRSLEKSQRKEMKKAKIKTPERFISWHPKNPQKLFKKLSESKESVVELVCHPGYFDEKCSYPYNKNREEELSILKSKKFQKAIENFLLTTYSQI